MTGMHVDHVGSLLRPESLKSAFLAFGAGQLSAGRTEAGAERRDPRSRREAASDRPARRDRWRIPAVELAGELFRGRGLGPVERLVEELPAESAEPCAARAAADEGRRRGRLVPRARDGAPQAQAQLPARGVPVPALGGEREDQGYADGPRSRRADVRSRAVPLPLSRPRRIPRRRGGDPATDGRRAQSPPAATTCRSTSRATPATWIPQRSSACAQQARIQ
jgi:hypothetical protein